MDIFFQDPDAIPLPPAEVRVKELRAAPWEDNRRIGVYIEITPFQKKPSVELAISDPSGNVSAHASIIETIIPKMELTLHLRGQIVPGPYTVSASIYYIEGPQGETDDPSYITDPSSHRVVDQAQVVFEIRPPSE